MCEKACLTINFIDSEVIANDVLYAWLDDRHDLGVDDLVDNPFDALLCVPEITRSVKFVCRFERLLQSKQ